MHLVLVFPPFVPATSPPLGICALKGYLNSARPDWKVTTVDWNLAAQEEILSRLERGARLDPSAFREGLLGEIALARGVECFRGGNNYEFYCRPDRYTIYADLLQGCAFGRPCQSCIHAVRVSN